ncbi:MAG: hypothetical protein AB1679_04675 [Actinomycetota bacterium]|jgi:hypothetical protein
MMKHVRRSLCLAAVAALPFTVGAGVAHAEGVSAGQDRLYVDSDSDLTGNDQLLLDVRAGTTDNNGDASGVRSRTTSSDIQDVQEVRSDTRTVSNDEGNNSTSGRAILGVDDVSLDDENNDRDDTGMNSGQLAVQRDDARDEQQYTDDAEFVFGQ